MKKSISYNEAFQKYLRDPEIAASCLNEMLMHYDENDKESQILLLICLRDIAQAQGGLSLLAKKTGLGRESLYKTLSSEGNPKLGTLKKIAKALGFDITFTKHTNLL